jgi:hypothetical protein
VEGFINHSPVEHTLRVELDLPPLIPGNYFVTLWAGSHNTETFDQVDEVVTFSVMESPTEGRIFPHHASHGYIVPPSRVTVLDRAAVLGPALA